MPTGVCILKAWEVSDWKEKGARPDCRKHKHVAKIKALEMTGRGDYQVYFTPIARWVGPRQIQVIRDRHWQRRRSGNHTTMQLVEGTG